MTTSHASFWEAVIGAAQSLRGSFMTQRDPKKFLEMLRRDPNLNKEEFDFLKHHLALTCEIGVSAVRGVIVHQGRETAEDVNLTGATPNMASIGNYEAGKAIGQSVSVDGIPFKVVGVAKIKGSEAAIQWIASEFAKAGLKPLSGDSYLQPVPLVEFTPDRTLTRLEPRARAR